ncbi:hypothetical protein GCM10027289_16080 [Tsukamurella serpentis]
MTGIRTRRRESSDMGLSYSVSVVELKAAYALSLLEQRHPASIRSGRAGRVIDSAETTPEMLLLAEPTGWLSNLDTSTAAILTTLVEGHSSSSDTR